MFRGLSVLPFFFMVFIVLFLSADIGIAYPAPLPPEIESPAVYGSDLSNRYSRGYNYDQTPAVSGYGIGSGDIPGSVPYRLDSGLGGSQGYSNYNSFNRSSLAYPGGYRSLDRYEQYLLPSGAINSADTSQLKGLDVSQSPLSGGINDYNLSSFDGKLGDTQFRREKYRGIQSRQINVFQGPPSSDANERARNLERLAIRKRMENEELLHKSEVYLKQDKSFSQEVTSDVNLSGKSLNDKASKKNTITESLALPESLEVEKPLSPDEFRQMYLEMFDREELKEKLKEKETDEFEDLLKDVNDTNAADESKVLKRDDKKANSDDEKNARKAKSVDFPDPMNGVTPANIDAKLKESREKIKKLKDFENHVNERYLEYLSAAGKYLAEGQYYNAMDFYKIAGAWKDNDPHVYAGQAFAHLAVGEYASSSTFLIRSLESSGEFAVKKIDVAASIGNKKLYDQRLGEVKDLYEAGRFYKTAFLLAYLYCQDGDLARAKECIDTAAPKMDKTQAWKSLNKAIENKQKPEARAQG